MNIFDILKEAKSPSKFPNKTITVSSNNSNDYTEDIDDTSREEVVINGNSSDTSTDYTEEVEDVESEDNVSEDDTSTDNESTDYTDNLDSDEESTDYTEDVDTDNGGNSDNYQPSEDTEEQSPEENLENQKNLELLNTVINLYYSISGTCAKLDSITHPSVLANSVTIKVKKNFLTLSEYIYKFITTQFNKNAYVKNLYIYNHIIESYKINIEMLKKISIFR